MNTGFIYSEWKKTQLYRNPSTVAPVAILIDSHTVDMSMKGEKVTSPKTPSAPQFLVTHKHTQLSRISYNHDSVLGPQLY